MAGLPDEISMARAARRQRYIDRGLTVNDGAGASSSTEPDLSEIRAERPGSPGVLTDEDPPIGRRRKHRQMPQMQRLHRQMPQVPQRLHRQMQQVPQRLHRQMPQVPQRLHRQSRSRCVRCAKMSSATGTYRGSHAPTPFIFFACKVA